MRRKNLLFTVFLMLIILGSCFQQKTVHIVELKCQSLINPTGIDNCRPYFSWILESDKRGQNQTAYQIIVADNEKDIDSDKGSAWNSGKISSNQTFAVYYEGQPLVSNRTYYWKVRIWDMDGNTSKFSQTARFTTSILDSVVWKAKWMGMGTGKDPVNKKGFYDKAINIDEEGDSICYHESSLLLRKEFSLSKPVKQAILHVCGLGLYELSINGKRIGTKVLNPAKTNYNKVVLYDSYDVTSNLDDEDNVIGIMLGNGWFNPIHKWWSWRMQWFGEKRAKLQMHLTFKDNSTQIITSDGTWKIAEGPVREHCIYDGEVYDAGREFTGWDKSGFDDSEWEFVKIVNPPRGALKSQIMPAIAQTEKLKPISVTQPNDTIWVVDFGQNFAGWVKIHLKEEEGSRLTIRYAENGKDGMIDVSTNLMAMATDTYIAKGGVQEIYEPRFTYHGFRYVEISGLSRELSPDDIEGVVVHSAVEHIGHFECSNEQINRIHQAILWSQRSNLMGFPTDCPQREERLGWIGDAHVVAEEAIYNFDMNLFYTKWLNDIRANQDTLGYIPYVAPRPISLGHSAISWSSGYHLIVWYNYLYYGDIHILADNYETMKKYVDYLTLRSSNFIAQNDKYGDWVSPLEGWSQGLPMCTSTAFYYYITSILAKSASLLGIEQDAQEYLALSESIKKAFNQKFYHPEERSYDNGSQCANALALFMNIVPEPNRKEVLQTLIEDIKSRNGHLTTGILGTKYLMEILSLENRSDIAWLVATRTDYPGWIHMIKNRTTLSEHWDQSGSSNHVMLGSIDSWFYHVLAGIRPDEHAPGYENIVIKPFFPEDLSWVKASVGTARGDIVSEWEKRGNRLQMKVEIPVNSTATIYIPAEDSAEVHEGSVPAGNAEGVTFLKMEDNHAVYNIGSGIYHFAVN